MHAKRPPSVALAATLVTLLVTSPSIVFSQYDPGWLPVRIYQILDPGGTRLAAIVVTGSAGRGYEEGNETWRFSEEALREIAEQEKLEISVWAEGDWDDRWVVEALAWRPEGDAVEWSHPATVEWNEGEPPVVPGGTYFGNATLGGLMIQYSPRGPSSLTWFKLTEGPYMLIGDGAVFEQDKNVPETGSWWQGSM
jgi:hypothetical protein